MIVHSELEGMWKVTGWAYLEVASQKFLRGLSKNTKNVSQDSFSRDSKLTPLKYRLEA
jgi:hypothetical protein